MTKRRGTNRVGHRTVICAGGGERGGAQSGRSADSGSELGEARFSEFYTIALSGRDRRRGVRRPRGCSRTATMRSVAPRVATPVVPPHQTRHRPTTALIVPTAHMASRGRSSHT